MFLEPWILTPTHQLQNFGRSLIIKLFKLAKPIYYHLQKKRKKDQLSRVSETLSTTEVSAPRKAGLPTGFSFFP